MENNKAYIITGPTSGIGLETALEMANHGTVILVARNAEKLKEVAQTIKAKGGNAISILCDVSDMNSVKKAALEIINLNVEIAGLLNNAGIMPSTSLKNTAQNLDMGFATNYLGAFALTEALKNKLPSGANVVFIGSAIEDAERKPAKILGMKGGRFISVEASSNGKWKEGGSKLPGIDAYATSKLCVLAAAMSLSREDKNLNYNVVEPGINPDTRLSSGGSSAFMSFLFAKIISRMPPFAQYRSTPQKAAKVIANVLMDNSGKTGIYFDEKGVPMQGSILSQDEAFQDKVVAETRTLLQNIS